MMLSPLRQAHSVRDSLSKSSLGRRLAEKKHVRFQNGPKSRIIFEMLEMFHQHLKETERDIGNKFVWLTALELIPVVSLGCLEASDELVNSGK